MYVCMHACVCVSGTRNHPPTHPPTYNNTHTTCTPLCTVMCTTSIPLALSCRSRKQRYSSPSCAVCVCVLPLSKYARLKQRKKGQRENVGDSVRLCLATKSARAPHLRVCVCVCARARVCLRERVSASASVRVCERTRKSKARELERV